MVTTGTVSTQHSEDIAFARALHGKEIKTGLLANLSSKNADVHNVATEAYLNMWKKPENESKEDEEKRLNSYTTLVNSYYNLATDFYEYGEPQMMMMMMNESCNATDFMKKAGVAVSIFAGIIPVRNSFGPLLVTNTTWLPIWVSSMA